MTSKLDDLFSYLGYKNHCIQKSWDESECGELSKVLEEKGLLLWLFLYSFVEFALFLYSTSVAFYIGTE